ncbi:nitrate reductase molybdenum cofactor assembly chaperone [Sphingomonas sp. MAH-20]|jgi:nitrate reductase delta subunit|uniref:Nitrate reductase molybdenum cofactor assembly chaperone n=2 Tax=Sphingomonadaceae TaxID=41297 RepID=A0A6I4J176_9SPHN|nr:nitrate reductase molybdenum cofactor assembly chaperone [Sphingomonas sp. CGMCC 1.13658]MVO77843.1 nitrate reductase molybdenum cofactor assembly chaperone [Sphingomonas horti]
MQTTLRALAALLGYPSPELQAHAGEVRDALRSEAALPGAALDGLEPLLRRLESRDLLDLQSDYSELFDRSRSLSLHLFEHVHGDNRERGQAMIDLGQQYVESGFFLDGGELPDFVPVFLEFASCLPPAEAREMLAQPAHVYAALAERLDKRETPYAAIFHALVALAGGKLDVEALRELREREPDEDPARLDDDWEEAPVTFNATAAHEMGGPTGVVAKIRAANRAGREAGR